MILLMREIERQRDIIRHSDRASDRNKEKERGIQTDSDRQRVRYRETDTKIYR